MPPRSPNGRSPATSSTSEQSSNPGRNTCITHAGYNAAVTGAGSGNGKAIAETLLAEGARVALLDIDQESLKDTTSRFAFAVPVDVADADSVHDAIGAIEQEFGHLDILVNNAGIVRSGNFADLPLHEWSEVFPSARGPGADGGHLFRGAPRR